MAASEKEQMESEIKEMRIDLKTYEPGKQAEGLHGRKEVQFSEQLYIGLFGRTGIGKTSLINSLKFAVAGSLRKGKWLAVATHEKAGGHTLNRVLAPLTNNIYVIDNRGFADLAKEGTLKELEAQMDGRRGYSEEVKWEISGGAAADDYINDVDDRKNSIGCAVFVFSALDNLSESTNGLQEVVTFLREQQGGYPVAVITNVDCGDRQRVEALLSTLRVTGISEIFEVANITKNKTSLESSYQHNLLSLLDRCVTDGDANAVYKHYRRKEQMEKQNREEKQKMEEKERREEKQKMEDKQKKEEQEKKQATQVDKIMNIEEKKIAVMKGVVLTTAAGSGAVVGSIAGPIGAAVGAGVGAVAGGVSLLIGKLTRDR